MKDKELRKTIIEDGTLKLYTEKRNELIKAHAPREPNGNFAPELYEMPAELVKECENARQARSKQRRIIEEHLKWLTRVLDLFGIDLFFGTWTFNDNALKLSADTRKQTIRRLLTPLFDYILNIDFGKENGREHYHGVIAVKRGTYKITSQVYSERYKCMLYNIDLLDNYKLGWYDLQKVNLDGTERSEEKLSRYMTKLTQHSIKVRQSYVSVKKGSEYQKWQKNKRYQLRTHQQMTVDFMTQQADLYLKSTECPF